MGDGCLFEIEGAGRILGTGEEGKVEIEAEVDL